MRIGDRFRLWPWLLLIFVAGWPAFPLSGNELDIEALKRIEAQVQQVVRSQMGVVVAVTDGVGYGSGVIVSQDGLVLTAGHVLVTGGDDFRVIFPDGREFGATLLGRNLNHDAGMVRIEGAGPWPHAEIGNIADLRAGDWCVCLGHSGGYELGRRPPVRAGRILDFEVDQLITDCVLIGGDSGGPLFDLSGRVIGIHSSIGGSVAENRHVSIAIYRKFWNRLVAGERWGVLPELAELENRDNRASMGIRVDRASSTADILLVHSGRAAARAGLQAGDVILRFNGIPVNSGQHVIDLIGDCNAGEPVRLVIRRDGEELKITVVLDAWKTRTAQLRIIETGMPGQPVTR